MKLGKKHIPAVAANGQVSPVAVQKKRVWVPLAKIVIVVVLTAGIFSAGWAVGSGRIKINAYKPVGDNKKLPAKLDYSSIDQIYDLLKQKYDGKLDVNVLLDGMKEGLTKAAGDPYTEYFNPKDAQDFKGQLDGTFQGIGAELGKDDSKNIIIISPLAGYPAEKAGLKPKDIIASIDDKSAYDMTINDAVSHIRGPKGTSVKLKVVRDGAVLDFTIDREQISIPSVTSKVDNSIGTITISRFGEDTAALTTKAANEFKAAGVKGIILDLRGNPGGYLDAAVAVSSLWLQNKTVLTERRENVIIETFKSQGDSPLAGIPTVVLINEGSASASEITAGALKDNGAAQLVGVKSFGKGSVQEPQALPNGGLIKITIARWYTPAGKNIDKEGITPDFSIKLVDDDVKNGKDAQKDKALDLLPH